MNTIIVVFILICVYVLWTMNSEMYIGAKEVKPSRYPWFVTIGETPDNPSCGGCLIHPRVILTAGHCIKTKRKYASLVNSKNEKQVRKIMHAEKAYNTKQDLGVIIVDKPFDSTPIDIGVNETLRHGRDIHGIGYGMDGNKKYQDTLQKTTVTYINPGGCYYGPPEETFFCTKSRRRAACFGDSGGPAFVRHSKKDFLVGLTSHGPKDCTRQGDFLYTVYTDMTNPVTLKLLLDLLRTIVERIRSGEIAPSE